MSIGLPQYGEYMYVWYGSESKAPAVGDIVALGRGIPEKAGVILQIVKHPSGWAFSGQYRVLWTDGKRTVVQGSSLLKIPAVLKDAEKFYRDLDLSVSKANALKDRAKIKGELDELA